MTSLHEAAVLGQASAAIQRAAQGAETEVEATGRDAGRRRPSLVRDADGVRDRLPGEMIVRQWADGTDPIIAVSASA